MRFMDVQNMRRATLRRLVGAPTFADELELHRVDCAASHGMLDNYEFLLSFQKDLAAEPVLPDPWITGNDIMALGIPQGPEVGTWHKVAYDAQLESRFPSRDALLSWLSREICPSPDA
jgi:poly(A) polymerase